MIRSIRSIRPEAAPEMKTPGRRQRPIAYPTRASLLAMLSESELVLMRNLDTLTEVVMQATGLQATGPELRDAISRELHAFRAECLGADAADHGPDVDACVARIIRATGIEQAGVSMCACADDSEAA